MTGAKIVAALIIGALHRRSFGGWLGIRGALMRITPLVWAAPFWCLAWGREVWLLGWHVQLGGLDLQLPDLLAPGWAVAALATAAVWMHWNDGHRFDRPWKLLLRYGWAPVIISVLTNFWPAMAVGPVVALSAAVLRPMDHRLPRVGGFLDGWAAYWEMVLGGTSAAMFLAAALVGLK